MAIEFKASKGLTEQIAEYLESRIVHLELKPGERLLKWGDVQGAPHLDCRDYLRCFKNMITAIIAMGNKQ